MPIITKTDPKDNRYLMYGEKKFCNTDPWFSMITEAQ